MFEILFEDEKHRVRVDESNWRVGIYFKISTAIWPNKGGRIELSYSE